MKRALVFLMVVAGCGGAPARSADERTADSAPAATALQAGRFDAAVQLAAGVLARDPQNARAAAVRATASYVRAGHALIRELRGGLEHAQDLGVFDNPAGRAAWQRFLDELTAIDRDLAVAAGDPAFSLELCLACWERDWNGDDRVDDRDRKLLELEDDGHGGQLAADDPRRRPTFRFDVGDADWARAMISFQRAAGELVLAYRWSELDQLLHAKEPPAVTIHLSDPARVARARTRILQGLDFADRCRRAYLAETDDDREWVPSPRQRNHPLPLEADAAVYATWEAITGDLRRLLTSAEGLSLRALAGLIDDELVPLAPDAYVDLGRLLASPADLTIDLSSLSPHRLSAATVEHILRGLLQHGYQPTMRPSPLPGRLAAMKRDLDRGTDTLEHKLRYLLWLN